MIMGERKEMQALEEMLAPYKKIALVGCKGCVTVCNAGGKKEVELLSAQLKLARKQQKKEIEIIEITLERQCDPEYIEQVEEQMEEVAAVLSMACGVGVQFMAERYDRLPVLPALNTTFMGGTESPGEYVERCQACGACKLHLTGGICPIARCSKSLLNGPCGGSDDGKCEINPDIPCAWQLIFDRMKQLGQMDNYEKINEVNDWSTSRDGGPRRISREDMK